jgi:hypothetical protein
MVAARERVSAHYRPVDAIGDMLEERCSITSFQTFEDLANVVGHDSHLGVS